MGSGYADAWAGVAAESEQLDIGTIALHDCHGQSLGCVPNRMTPGNPSMDLFTTVPLGQGQRPMLHSDRHGPSLYLPVVLADKEHKGVHPCQANDSLKHKEKKRGLTPSGHG